MAVTYLDHTADKSTENVTSPSFEHVASAGSDRLLLVWLIVQRQEGGSSSACSSVTFDGNSLTFLHRVSKGPSYPYIPAIELWYRVLGTSGTADTGDIAFTTQSGVWNPYAGIAVTISGVDQADPVGVWAYLAGSSHGTAIEQSITTDTANSRLFGCISAIGADTAPFAPRNSETERVDDTTDGSTSTDFGFWVGDLAAATVQSYDFGCTASASEWGILSVKEVHEAAGGTESQASRDARTHGKATSQDDRSARTHGKTTSQDDRSARTHGKATSQDDRAARTHGGIVSQDDRDARTHGQAEGQDDRAARTHGKATSQDDRSARTHGQSEGQDDRDARTHGKATGQDDRDARTHGLRSTQQARWARTDGKISVQANRAARTHGMARTRGRPAPKIFRSDLERGHVRRFKFSGQTVQQLRAELNDFARDLAENLQTEKLTCKMIRWIPIERPDNKDETSVGLMFFDKDKFVDSTYPLFLVLPAVNATSIHKRMVYSTHWTSIPFPPDDW